MIEDKLTHDERLRLECVAQAVAFAAGPISRRADDIVDVARTFESYVRGSSS